MTVRQSTYLSFASRYAGVIINFIAIIVIARVLTPAEIGIFTVSAAFVTLSQVVRDTGVGTYLIQEQDLTRQRLRTAMGVALSIGAVLALVIFALGAPMAAFYREESVEPVMHILAITFFLMPVNAVGLSLMKRELAFGKSFFAETASNLTWAGVAIWGVYAGLSYYSMALASLVSVLVLYLSLLVLKPDSVLVWPALTHWKRVLSVSSVVSLTQLISQVGLIAPAFILGRLASFSDVAFYSRGDSLIRTFRDTIEAGAGAVALPAFAADLREGAFNKSGYCYVTSLITGVSWPLYAVLAILAYPVTHGLFGPQWDAAVPVLQILAVMNIIYAPALLSSHVMFAMGAFKTALFKEIAIQGARVLLILVAAPYGVVAVAVSQLSVFAGALVLNHVLLRRLVGVTIGDLANATGRSAVLMLAAMAGPLCTMAFLPSGSRYILLQLILGGILAVLGWLIAVLVLNHPLSNEISLVGKKMFPRRVRQAR